MGKLSQKVISNGTSPGGVEPKISPHTPETPLPGPVQLDHNQASPAFSSPFLVCHSFLWISNRSLNVLSRLHASPRTVSSGSSRPVSSPRDAALPGVQVLFSWQLPDPVDEVEPPFLWAAITQHYYKRYQLRLPTGNQELRLNCLCTFGD